MSVIIPARNASETLAATLDSLLRQTNQAWEAIVVDNGSTDNTRGVAESFAAQDARFRVITESKAGVCSARNTGIKSARHDWLLFLDADDYILPEYITTMAQAAMSDPGVDAWYCGSMRVDHSGENVTREFVQSVADMFPLLARMSLFPIHACLVRKAIIEQADGFDMSLITCEDWDLWQRLARMGARFRSVPEYLACYRMRPRSASINGRQMLADGLEVIDRGHTRSPQKDSDILHLHHHSDSVSEVKLQYLCWPAGLAIGCGEDPLLLLELVRNVSCADMNPFVVAETLFKSIPLPHCAGSSEWPELWPKHESEIKRFLKALEAHARCANLAHRAQIVLERLIIEASPRRKLQLELLASTPVEITKPVETLVLVAPVERFIAAVYAEGEFVGTVELPVCDEALTAKVTKDAIADRFGWQIIGKFFKRSIYWKLIIHEEPQGYSVWRDGICLAHGLPAHENTIQQFHDQMGWTVFLQELWQRPALSAAAFYNADRTEATPSRVIDAGESPVRINVEEQIPALRTGGDPVVIDLCVAGSAVARIGLRSAKTEISPSQLIAEVTQIMGLELLKIVVREGLIGRAWDEFNLIQLLLIASEAKNQQCSLNALLEHPTLHFIVGTRSYGFLGSSISRHSVVPGAAATEFVLSAAVNKESTTLCEAEHFPATTLYNPELLSNSFSLPDDAETQLPHPSSPAQKRHDFESLFASSIDPWRYNTSEYEQLKYQQTLALVPKRGTIRQATELGCAEGHFTELLAPRVKTLVAADISGIALQRAAKRCQHHANIVFRHLDLGSATLPEENDLIVCSEVLYYLRDVEHLRMVAGVITSALNRGGYLLTTHSFASADNNNRTGFNWDVPFGSETIGRIFSEQQELRLVRELQTKLYSIKLFRKVRGTPKLHKIVQKIKPPRLEFANHGALPREIEKQVNWDGGTAAKRLSRAGTAERLPILVYHRVAPMPDGRRDHFCVSPDAFEAQLRYLHDCGFHTVSLDEWGRAKTEKRGVRGRPVLLTFDDGFADFKTWAWPLLCKCKFSATMFVVAGHVGRTNSWELSPDRETELLGWEDLKQLKAEGLHLGAHSFTHRHMTGLSPAEIVIEACRSRRTLEQGLDAPVLSFAYPYGDTDQVVQHLTGACGFIYGLTCETRPATFGDSLLALPRIEINATDTMESFVTKLAAANR